MIDSEVKAKREEFKRKGFVGFFLKPTLDYWKEKPLHAIGTFLFWAILFYSILNLVQAVNFDMIYCNSSVEGYNGKVMDVYNPFIAMVNSKVKEIGYDIDNDGMVFMPQELENYNIYCDYDFKRWSKESIDDRFRSVIVSFKRLVLKQ